MILASSYINIIDMWNVYVRFTMLVKVWGLTLTSSSAQIHWYNILINTSQRSSDVELILLLATNILK